MSQIVRYQKECKYNPKKSDGVRRTELNEGGYSKGVTVVRKERKMKRIDDDVSDHDGRKEGRGRRGGEESWMGPVKRESKKGRNGGGPCRAA